ncbi:hypothetical protein [Poseidonibacter sp.]|uniref:hypothetical protein n=1 Tax=Poseidonibacter sp. TaxID=2321188 RepID=UPI003C7645E1
MGKELWELGLFKDIHENQQAFRELQEKNYIRYENLPLLSKNGQKKEVEFISNLYDVAGEQIIQCNIRDVSLRKKVEKQLLEARMFSDNLLQTANVIMMWIH